MAPTGIGPSSLMHKYLPRAALCCAVCCSVSQLKDDRAGLNGYHAHTDHITQVHAE